jgi:hypothetical protein
VNTCLSIRGGRSVGRCKSVKVVEGIEVLEKEELCGVCVAGRIIEDIYPGVIAFLEVDKYTQY